MPTDSGLTRSFPSRFLTLRGFHKTRYHRLVARRGKKRTIVTIAHYMLESAQYMLTITSLSRVGGDYYDQRKKESKVPYFTHCCLKGCFCLKEKIL